MSYPSKIKLHCTSRYYKIYIDKTDTENARICNMIALLTLHKIRYYCMTELLL